MPRHRSHSTDFKRQVVAEYHAGETLHALGRRHDLSRNLIRIAIVDEALVRIAALYKDRGRPPRQGPRSTPHGSPRAVPSAGRRLLRLACRPSCPRISRKSDLGKALAYMLRRQTGFRLFLEDGRVDMDSNRVENAIHSPAMNRRNALFAGHDEGGRNWARFTSLIGTCKMNGVEPYAYLRDLFTKLANGQLDTDIDAPMPWT